MKLPSRQLLCVGALCALTAGCQSRHPDGDYVTFVREVMIESGRVAEQHKAASHRSDQAVGAVVIWRSADGTEGEEVTTP